MSDSEEQYSYYYKKGKRYYKCNKYEQSIAALREAYKIKPSEELQSKINKLEDLIEPHDTEQFEFKQDENKTLIEGKFYVNTSNYEKLYNYQQDGVLWLFKLFQNRKGGILADDMGLGKTVQVIFFLRELYESDLIKSALIVMPKSLLINWERELTKWAPDLTVLMYIGNERERNVAKIRRRGGILLTTYGTIMHSWDDLNKDPNFKWNVLALDEGHKIKNPSSKTFKTINAIRADMRLVMTGTAVQNKLKELWALFDFTHQGSLLGTYPTFLTEYERPLTASRNKDALECEKIYGDEISQSLKKLIKPYFLRRTKEEVTKTVVGMEGKSVPKLLRKNDLIVWIQMTDKQIDIYNKFLQMDEVKRLLTMSEKRSPLLELNILKKICDHPRLMPAEHCAELGMTFAESIQAVDIAMLQKESGKMEFLLRLLNELVEEGHKCLVFSQSKVVLNIVERILRSNNIRQLRLDGDVLKPTDRQHIVDQFNNDPAFRVLLLTSQVGGVGLTLTGADRAVIYDLSWNPSVDAQAVDRLYRIGQLKNVVVYRLITCGTVEEKIYRRQIFKDSVNRQTTGVEQTDQNPFRYFTQGELRELFTLDDPRVSKTQLQLEEMHAQHRKSDHKLDSHLSWLSGQNIFGVSDHDLMFSQEGDSVDVDEETHLKLLENRRQAEQRLQTEAKTSGQDEESQLRMMMSTMSLHEYKVKAREKAALSQLFIPKREDVKKTLYNVASKTGSMLQYLQTSKRKKEEESRIGEEKGVEECVVIVSDEEEEEEEGGVDVHEISDDETVMEDGGEWAEYREEDYEDGGDERGKEELREEDFVGNSEGGKWEEENDAFDGDGSDDGGKREEENDAFDGDGSDDGGKREEEDDAFDGDDSEEGGKKEEDDAFDGDDSEEGGKKEEDDVTDGHSEGGDTIDDDSDEGEDQDGVVDLGDGRRGGKVIQSEEEDESESEEKCRDVVGRGRLMIPSDSEDEVEVHDRNGDMGGSMTSTPVKRSTEEEPLLDESYCDEDIIEESF